MRIRESIERSVFVALVLLTVGLLIVKGFVKGKMENK
jgi:hypothetical protein